VLIDDATEIFQLIEEDVRDHVQKDHVTFYSIYPTICAYQIKALGAYVSKRERRYNLAIPEFCASSSGVYAHDLPLPKIP
jgi:hypothetical protein